MPGIDQERPFVPVRLAILTVSDTRTPAEDRSGDTLEALAREAGHEVVERAIVRDEPSQIRTTVEGWCRSGRIDAVVTTGGTGFTGRDVTPETLEPLFDKRMDGFSLLFHLRSLETVGLSTIQSRATAGLVGSTFVFVLPGSPGACRDAWNGILASQLDIRYRPCNFVEIMPRLEEHLPEGVRRRGRAG